MAKRMGSLAKMAAKFSEAEELSDIQRQLLVCTKPNKKRMDPTCAAQAQGQAAELVRGTGADARENLRSLLTWSCVRLHPRAPSQQEVAMLQTTAKPG